jgi:hypothetical protein
MRIPNRCPVTSLKCIPTSVPVCPCRLNTVNSSFYGPKPSQTESDFLTKRAKTSSRGPQRMLLRRIDTPQGQSLSKPGVGHCPMRVLRYSPSLLGSFGLLLAKELSSLAVLLLWQDLTLQATLSDGVAIVRQTLSRVSSAMGAERAKKGRMLVLRPVFDS